MLASAVATRPWAGHTLRVHSRCSIRSTQTCPGTQCALSLVPTGTCFTHALNAKPSSSAPDGRLFRLGNGSCRHLDREVQRPSSISLDSGVFEVGREAPADIVVPVPTVSGHHAMLRIGKSPAG